MHLLPRCNGLLFLAAFLSSTADPSLDYSPPFTGIIFEGLFTQIEEIILSFLKQIFIKHLLSSQGLGVLSEIREIMVLFLWHSLSAEGGRPPKETDQ